MRQRVSLQEHELSKFEVEEGPHNQPAYMPRKVGQEGKTNAAQEVATHYDKGEEEA